MQNDILRALNEIQDPELGIGIVDLGLVYRADWNKKGIEVEFTTTSPSCPFSALIFEQIDDVLHQHFGEAASIRVKLVREPLWTLDRMTENARHGIGWDRPRGHSSGAVGVRHRSSVRRLLH